MTTKAKYKTEALFQPKNDMAKELFLQLTLISIHLHIVIRLAKSKNKH
jgi:hypothetical protein